MEIVPFPHPALRWKSKPVVEINAALRKTVAEMFELMYDANGIGLAANQVALPLRVFILNLTAEAGRPDEELVFINPEIVKYSGQTEGEEGCLSFPGLYGPVKRAAEVVIDAFNLKGENFQLSMKELGSRAVQHELDHLDGVLFVDRMIDAERRKVAPVVEGFETQFRRWQAEGLYESDDVLRAQMAELEPKRPAKK